MLYRVILWIGVCTGAVFCCGNLANRSFAKQKMTKCTLVNNTFVHTAISMCVRLVQFVSLSLRDKKRKCDIGEKKWCGGVNVENYMMVHSLQPFGESVIVSFV